MTVTDSGVESIATTERPSYPFLPELLDLYKGLRNVCRDPGADPRLNNTGKLEEKAFTLAQELIEDGATFTDENANLLLELAAAQLARDIKQTDPKERSKRKALTFLANVILEALGIDINERLKTPDDKLNFQAWLDLFLYHVISETQTEISAGETLRTTIRDRSAEWPRDFIGILQQREGYKKMERFVAENGLDYEGKPSRGRRRSH